MSGWCLAVGRRDRVSGRSRSRTDKITSLSSWPLSLLAYSAVKWQVQESHLAGEGYEPLLSTRPPASMIANFHLQAPESNRGNRPYESQSGASRACIVTSDQGET